MARHGGPIARRPAARADRHAPPARAGASCWASTAEPRRRSPPSSTSTRGTVHLGHAGPSNEDAIGAEAAVRALLSAADEAMGGAGIADEDLGGAVLAVAGTDTPPSPSSCDAPATESWTVVNDVVGAWAVATGGGNGVAVIAGTGSNVFGVGPKGPWRAGGWGHVLGDEGGAYWLGVQSIKAAPAPPRGLRAADGAERRRWSSSSTCRASSRWPACVYSKPLDEVGNRGLCRAHAGKVADAGDEVAREIYERGARELGQQVAAVVERTGLAGEELPARPDRQRVPLRRGGHRPAAPPGGEGRPRGARVRRGRASGGRQPAARRPGGRSSRAGLSSAARGAADGRQRPGGTAARAPRRRRASRPPPGALRSPLRSPIAPGPMPSSLTAAAAAANAPRGRAHALRGARRTARPRTRRRRRGRRTDRTPSGRRSAAPAVGQQQRPPAAPAVTATTAPAPRPQAISPAQAARSSSLSTIASQRAPSASCSAARSAPARPPTRLLPARARAPAGSGPRSPPRATPGRDLPRHRRQVQDRGARHELRRDLPRPADAGAGGGPAPTPLVSSVVVCRPARTLSSSSRLVGSQQLLQLLWNPPRHDDRAQAQPGGLDGAVQGRAADPPLAPGQHVHRHVADGRVVEAPWRRSASRPPRAQEQPAAAAGISSAGREGTKSNAPTGCFGLLDETHPPPAPAPGGPARVAALVAMAVPAQSAARSPLRGPGAARGDRARGALAVPGRCGTRPAFGPPRGRGRPRGTPPRADGQEGAEAGPPRQPGSRAGELPGDAEGLLHQGLRAVRRRTVLLPVALLPGVRGHRQHGLHPAPRGEPVAGTALPAARASTATSTPTTPVPRKGPSRARLPAFDGTVAPPPGRAAPSTTTTTTGSAWSWCACTS